ncbi:MAG: beta-phosphoglucomutase [Clostridium sp.]|uniref:beta-phosphoglucomutase n=1 Tax=Clostridium sp. TaxID=1506 RepID=UPI001EC8101B|nr:beta-phosphoglucomutase [Clostridium sp.]MBS5884079.1 beta-phosphoglucomutase [Clostridium sp.]MDU7148033.1 beta-phosphoglucomutase [Clostridium sp.]
MIKGLIFDLDGVIVDTAKYHYLAWKQIAEDLNINFTLKDNELLKGVSRTKSFEIILEIGGMKMTNEEQEEYCHRKNKIYLEYVNKMTEDEILPGVKEFLIDAKAKGYKIALGSASKNAQLILSNTNMKKYFDAIIDGGKVVKAKPNPEVFTKGAYELGLKNEECIVFEDASAGVEAAHNANMLVVGIGNKEDLPEANICLDGLFNMTIDNIIDKL